MEQQQKKAIRMWKAARVVVPGILALTFLLNCGGNDSAEKSANTAAPTKAVSTPKATATPVKPTAVSGVTATQYFERLQRIADRYFLESEKLAEEFESDTDAAEDEDEVLVQFYDFFVKETDLIRQASTEIGNLSPPEELADVHADFVKALSFNVTAYAEITEQILELDSVEGLDDIFDSEPPGAEAFDAACIAIEKAASERNHTLDLDCANDD